MFIKLNVFRLLSSVFRLNKYISTTSYTSPDSPSNEVFQSRSSLLFYSYQVQSKMAFLLQMENPLKEWD